MKDLKRRLQLRFVLLSMAALLLLQSGIIGLSIWHSYRDMEAKSDVILSQIREQPSSNFRYFSVKVHPGKGSVRVDAVQNVSVTPEQAGEYAKTALHSQADKGFVDGYRYCIHRNNEGMQILFLSRHSSLEMHRSTAFSLIWVSIGGLAVMSLVLSLLSGIVVAPLVENHRKQKQFITSAGHQLKTPLAVIRADAQLLQSEIGDNEWLDSILSQTDHMTRMTHDLVALAQAEECETPMASQSFSLSDAAADTLDVYAGLADCKRITLHRHIPKKLDYQGVKEQIRQLLSILLDNACKYCVAGGEITFTLKREFSGVSISIVNTADGIAATPDKTFAQRFYRGENASGKEGFGLGLSIAQAIVQRHKGKLTVRTTDNTFGVYVMLR